MFGEAGGKLWVSCCSEFPFGTRRFLCAAVDLSHMEIVPFRCVCAGGCPSCNSECNFCCDIAY